MALPVGLEDAHGVDTAHIRELLRLTPAQRVAHMVQVVNVLRSVSSSAQATRG